MQQEGYHQTISKEKQEITSIKLKMEKIKQGAKYDSLHNKLGSIKNISENSKNVSSTLIS